MFTLLTACLAGPPETVTVQVWAPWPGASAGEVESSLTVAIEGRVASIPDARDVLGESWAGLSRVTVTVPASSVPALGRAVSRAAVPDGAELPQIARLPPEASAWIVPAVLPPELVGALQQTFAAAGAWSDTAAVRRVEVILPAGSPLAPEAFDALRRGSAGATVDDLLDGPLPGGSLRSRAVLVRWPEPRSRARWNGEPVDVWTIGAPAAEGARFWKAHGVPAVLLPPADALRTEVWGEADADLLEAAARTAGASDVLVVWGRALPGGAAEPARVEVLAWWTGSVPGSAPSSGAIAGDTVSVVRGAPQALAPLGPPPRTTWEVEVDPDRAAALGLVPEQVAAAVRDATVGSILVARDGTAIEVRAGEAATVEAVSAVPVGRWDTGPILVSDVATVTVVSEERARVRYDGAPAALVRGPVPDGLEVVASFPRLRIGQ